jgi:phage terminase large subunit-like protein
VATRTTWLETARPDQIPTYGDGQTIWLALAGRGWGKSKAIYEDTWWQAVQTPSMRVAIIAPTWSDLKKVSYFGRSGLKAVTPPEVLRGGSWETAFNVSDMLLTFANGATIQGFPATEPDRLRGPEHHLAVCEELAAWPYAQEAWDMMRMGLRLGNAPKTIIATTPRPTTIMRNLIKRADCRIIRGRTLDNSANLPTSFLTELHERYDGTRLGRQEIDGEILDDAVGALWTRDGILHGKAPDMRRIVVALIHPARQAMRTKTRTVSASSWRVLALMAVTTFWKMPLAACRRADGQGGQWSDTRRTVQIALWLKRTLAEQWLRASFAQPTETRKSRW